MSDILKVKLGEVPELPYQIMYKPAGTFVYFSKSIDHISVESLEGSIDVLPGDYVMIGSKFLEVWALEPSIFERVYVPTGDVEYEKMLPHHPSLIYKKAIKKEFPVKTFRCDRTFHVESKRAKSGYLVGNKGDYFCVEAPDNMWIVDRQVFENSYFPYPG
jgi:hypothetical protein